MLNARGCNATDGAVPPAAETAGRPVHAVLEDYLRKGGFQYARPPPPFNCRHHIIGLTVMAGSQF